MNVMTKKPEINMRARPTNLLAFDYAVVTWHLTVPPDVGMDQIMLPEFWAHVARKLQPHHRIVVDCEDQSWSARLFVREVERVSARVAVEAYNDFDKAEGGPELTPAEREEYEVKFRGPQIKHVVIRKSDKQEMVRGLSKRDAIDYIQQRQRLDEK